MRGELIYVILWNCVCRETPGQGDNFVS